jgi:hypothetical protein
MDGDQEIIVTRADGTSLLGTFSPDCDRLMNGVLVGGDTPTCFEAYADDPGK